LLATLASKNKGNNFDEFFENYFPLIKKYSIDERNFVKKAIDWAIRQIGKRNRISNGKCIDLCNEIIKEYPTSKSANWIAKTALKELKEKKEKLFS
jgi:3-methyladenine DNA glycosylase AlkD